MPAVKSAISQPRHIRHHHHMLDADGIQPSKNALQDVHFFLIRHESTLCHQSPDVLARCRIRDDAYTFQFSLTILCTKA